MDIFPRLWPVTAGFPDLTQEQRDDLFKISRSFYCTAAELLLASNLK
jgi:hypothetical protein